MPRRSGIGSTVAVITLAAGLALTGCSGPGSGSPEGDAPTGPGIPESCGSDKPILGVSLPNTVNPYYVAMRASFIENGEKAGFDVKVAIANDSDSNQLAQVQSFIEQNACIVALNPVSSGPGAAEVNVLSSAGIPVITVNINADTEQVEKGGGSILQYVGADQADGGIAMANAVIEDLGDTPAVVGIAGEPAQNVTVERVNAFTEELAKLSPESKVGASVDTNVDPQVALKAVTEMLQGNPSINTIFADTGPGAVGALQAIKQLGRTGEVALYGFCASDTALDDSLYRGCAAQQPSLYAQLVVENARTYIDGDEIPAEILQPVKVFVEGETPASDELG